MPPSIWPSTDSGLSARPTSCAVAIWTTLTRPSSGSTSTTARWATKANAVWQLPWPFSSRSSVGRWRYSTVSSNVDAVRRIGDRRRGHHRSSRRRRSPSITSRSGSTPWRPPTSSNSRSRTARQAASTAPPLIHVWRDADVDPADPICVSIGSSTTVVDAEHGAGDLLGDRDEALADLGGGELQRGHAVGEPAARRRVVVEALGVHQVLDRDAPADAAPHVPGVGGEPGAAGPAHRIVVVDRRGPSGIGSAAVSRMHRATGATLSTTWPVISRSPVTMALRSRISTGSSPHAAASLSICPSWAKQACTTPNPRIAPHGRLLVRTAQPSTTAFGAPVRALARA